MNGNLIIDLQFGSTGKGLIAGYLAERDRPDTVVTAWAANAGHTYIDGDGKKFIHTMLANGVVSPGLKRVLIGPGSLIDPVNLRRELDECAHLLRGVDVLIHPAAAVITQQHRDLEAGPMTKIGSTKKGVGEAAIQRIRRDIVNANTAWTGWGEGPHPELIKAGLGQFVCTHEQYASALDNTRRLLVEGAQGYSLSMYHGFYPYCTSRDVSTHQVLADCGIPAREAKGLTVVGTARTYPIRVANRHNEAGEQVGWSGPCYPDQAETTFEAIGQRVELTTVTKLPRRIFTFSEKQFTEAVRMNGIDEVFINFINYLPHERRGNFLTYLDNISGPACVIRYVGYGPTKTDVRDRLEEALRGRS
jgi:adenylosuccinate synthase